MPGRQATSGESYRYGYQGQFYSPYVAMGNDPVNMIDKDGAFAEPPGLGFIQFSLRGATPNFIYRAAGFTASYSYGVVIGFMDDGDLNMAVYSTLSGGFSTTAGKRGFGTVGVETGFGQGTLDGDFAGYGLNVGAILKEPPFLNKAKKFLKLDKFNTSAEIGSPLNENFGTAWAGTGGLFPGPNMSLTTPGVLGYIDISETSLHMTGTLDEVILFLLTGEDNNILIPDSEIDRLINMTLSIQETVRINGNTINENFINDAITLMNQLGIFD